MGTLDELRRFVTDEVIHPSDEFNTSLLAELLALFDELKKEQGELKEGLIVASSVCSILDDWVDYGIEINLPPNWDKVLYKGDNGEYDLFDLSKMFKSLGTRE